MPRGKKIKEKKPENKNSPLISKPEGGLSLDEFAKILKRDFAAAREEIVAICYSVPTHRLTEEMVDIYKTELRNALHTTAMQQRMGIDDSKIYIDALPVGVNTLIKGWFRKIDATGPGAKIVEIPTKDQQGENVWIMQV